MNSCFLLFLPPFPREQLKEKDRAELWKQLNELKLEFDSKRRPPLVAAK